jgi:broad specificity phosphatase PhoE
VIWLVRHGETEWSRDGRHTGRTDLELTAKGRQQAAAVAPLLADHAFAAVWSSPLRRARDTAALAGVQAQTRDDLRELDYGEYEGLTTHQIHEREPAWELFRDGSPGGDAPPDIERRVDELLAHLDADETNTLAFGHGHCFRALAARFLGLGVGMAAQLRLDAGSISVLAHERDGATIVLWNRRVPPRPILVGDIAIRVPDVTE